MSLLCDVIRVSLIATTTLAFSLGPQRETIKRASWRDEPSTWCTRSWG